MINIFQELSESLYFAMEGYVQHLQLNYIKNELKLQALIIRCKSNREKHL